MASSHACLTAKQTELAEVSIYLLIRERSTKKKQKKNTRYEGDANISSKSLQKQGGVISN